MPQSIWPAAVVLAVVGATVVAVVDVWRGHRGGRDVLTRQIPVDGTVVGPAVADVVDLGRAVVAVPAR